MRRFPIYIHEKHTNWNHFTWNVSSLNLLLGEVRHLQGLILGKMRALGFELRKDASLESLTLEVLKSNEIEGEVLNSDQVRSSIARKLGISLPAYTIPGRAVEGVVEMMMDATEHFKEPLTKERLFSWHNSLFPEGKSGMYTIVTGKWRDDSTGAMQVVSGAMGKEKVHYEAPAASRIEEEMKIFFNWMNADKPIDPVLKAAICHFWFVTIHPFDDGNGRIARALTELLLARSDGSSQRFYSMSAQIRLERNAYYKVLEKCQKGNSDITEWLMWFLNCLKNALLSSDNILEKVLNKHHFWNHHARTTLNQRQVFMLNKLLDDFSGKLNTSKWAKMVKCSQDTAFRDIVDLINKNVLLKEGAGGRSTNYQLIIPKASDN